VTSCQIVSQFIFA